MPHEELANSTELERTKESLLAKGYEVFVLPNREEALIQLRSLIPEDASVMHGSSVTLEQIGFTDLLKSRRHPWEDSRHRVREESDSQARVRLRRHVSLSDYYLGSVHALTTDGEFIVASNTASQLPSIAYNSPNLIFVVSTKKIVTDLNEGISRLTEHVLPLEDQHILEMYGTHTALNKILIFKGEPKGSRRQIFFLLVEENLGF